ncbi:sigma-70 family RNA polymerase sigma factor [Paraurantiacibacter namhicola]|uniref:RNA polymerase sigma factor CarQ n=1 Tax=Paraurantiacibacter namhicola TaxID=645517 RepID=A0A1C7D8J6_9SPHN|nr:sigma-70 family RNA polymerase sigma factor [Paraurantiacibacter namhicola]ANU07816.1 RNA polymerase sigma factor CarQ [Paraurantiacibacter namhicola]
MQDEADPLDRLIKAARSGDARAYHAFLAEAAERLRAFVRRRMPDAAQMEDIVQQCLIALHEKRSTLDPARPVAPWMYTIARYKLADHWRAASRFAPMEAAGEPEVPPDELAAADVAQLLQMLPAAQADAIRMTRIEGLTMEEAGQRAGASTSAMKVRVHRGMETLRNSVAEDME